MSCASEIFLMGVLSRTYTVSNKVGRQIDTRPRLNGKPLPVAYIHKGFGFEFSMPASDMADLLERSMPGSVITVNQSEDYPFAEQYQKTDKGWLAISACA